jgi:hypothetical protein
MKPPRVFQRMVCVPCHFPHEKENVKKGLNFIIVCVHLCLRFCVSVLCVCEMFGYDANSGEKISYAV